MADKSLREFSAPSAKNIRTGPTLEIGEDASFELKPSLINMVQANLFCGKAREDASAHHKQFLEIGSTLIIKDVDQDIILLRLFPFSLLEKAKQWFYANKANIEAWAKCYNAFLANSFLWVRPMF